MSPGVALCHSILLRSNTCSLSLPTIDSLAQYGNRHTVPLQFVIRLPNRIKDSSYPCIRVGQHLCSRLWPAFAGRGKLAKDSILSPPWNQAVAA